MNKALLALVLSMLVSLPMKTHGQGTVVFANGGLTRFNFIGTQFPVNVGLFFKPTIDAYWQLLQPVGTVSPDTGLMSVPNGSAYQIPGTEPGQIVFLQAYAWHASFELDYDAAWRSGSPTAITREGQFTLAPTTGPGTVIWSATDPTRFQPLQFPLGPPYPAPPVVPEPSTLALTILGGLLLFRCFKRQAR